MTSKIVAWGANSHGQLGLNFKSEQCLSPEQLDTSSVDLKINEICKIVGGAGHTIILTSKGTCYSCGWNHRGQLGTLFNGNNKDNCCLQKVLIPDDEMIVDVVCGWDSSAGLTANGHIFVWGSNAYGQLGVCMTSLQFEKPFKITLNNPVMKIAMGLRHTAIISQNGLLFVAGAGNHGQLGLVDSNGLPVKCVNQFTIVPELYDIVDVACGQYYTVVMTKTRDLFTFGNNKYGQLTLNSALYPEVYSPMKITNARLSEPIKVICAWTHSIMINGDGRIISWGRNTYGQLGRGKNATTEPDFIDGLIDVKQICVGSEHTIAVTNNGEVLSWGWNEHGNCGNGTTTDTFVPTKIKLPSSRVKIVGSGAGHSFAIIETEM